MATRTRILALLSSVLLFTVAASGFALFTLGRAGDELHRVAGHDVPLLKVVTEITAAHLEQSIRFERALRFARDQEDSPQARTRYDGAKEEFEDLAASIWSSLQEGRGIAERAAARPLPQVRLRPRAGAGARGRELRGRGDRRSDGG